MPGHGKDGPTLEIFQYEQNAESCQRLPNRPGFAHIAFVVTDFDQIHQKVQAHGGVDLGPEQILDIPGVGQLRLVYTTDPEGNILELQQWL